MNKIPPINIDPAAVKQKLKELGIDTATLHRVASIIEKEIPELQSVLRKHSNKEGFESKMEEAYKEAENIFNHDVTTPDEGGKMKEIAADNDQLKYIIIKIDYSTKLILPIEKGMKLIELWSGATQLKEEYSKPPVLSSVTSDFTIKFISEKEMQVMKVAQILEIPNA